MRESRGHCQKLPLPIAVPTYLIVVAIALIAFGYRFPTSNTLIELPPILSILKPGIYTHDYYVQDALQITPRYYYQYLIFFIIKAIKSLPLAYFLAYLAAFSSYLLGLYSIGLFFGRSRLAAASLCFLGLTVVDGTVGYVSLFRSEPIPAIFAMGLAVWGIYFCLVKRWTLGYLFLGITCLIHFLVGLLPAGLILPLLLVDAGKKKNVLTAAIPLAILVGFASLIYVPMVLTGKTSTGLISNQEFIYFYGYIRQPHHIIPSVWPARTWRNFICFLLAGLLYLRSIKQLNKEDKTKIILVIAGSTVALLCNYFFVEVYPLALVAKLQLARTTPFAQLMVLIAVATLASEQWNQGNRALGATLLIVPGLHNGGMLMLLIAIGMTLIDSESPKPLLTLSRFSSQVMLCISVVLLAAYPDPVDGAEVLLKLGLPLLLFAALLLPAFVEAMAQIEISSYLKSGILALIALGVIGIIGFGIFDQLPGFTSDFLTEQVSIYRPNTDAVTQLALRFQDLSDKNALVLTPPSKTNFRFYSQRSVVFNLYSSPFTDAGYKEWYHRLTRVLGEVKPPINHRNMDDFFAARTATELIGAAQEFRADYILTKSEWHPHLKGTVLDSEGAWTLYKID